MKPSPFHYHDPETIADVLDLLADEPNSKLLAGGQSLMPMLNLRFLQPDAVIDLNRVRALTAIDVTADEIRIGAMVRQRTLQFDGEMASHAPIFQHALQFVGHYQTRARGTIGGSLCHLDPSAELPALTLLHDAVMHVGSRDGLRDIPAAEWAVAYMAPALEPADLLVGLSLKPWSSGHGWGFHELARRRGDFALASAGCLLELDADDRVSRVALAISGVCYVPTRLATAEAFLLGQQLTEEALAAVEQEARQAVEIDDVHVPISYRQQLVAVLLRRSIADAVRRVKELRHVG